MKARLHPTPAMQKAIDAYCDEYRKYRDYIPRYDSWIWTATPWYCGDGDYGSYTGHAVNVRCVGRGGLLGKNGAHYSCAVAPACILNPKSLNLRKNMFVVFYALGVSAGREATQQRGEDISMEHTHGGEK